MDAKISHSGLLARSPEGHAARGMQIKGNEDLWVEIQANTFRNWVNENLPSNMRVADLGADLRSGVRLCALVETLQGKPIKPSWNKKPGNQHHYLENVTAALTAIEQDGVKLVNIGNVDIVNGNLKLILGLIWSLIVRYQIGRSKFPPRKLMLAWLQAVLPECKVSNLTTDWNSGILLSALVDYCQPGLYSNWKSLNKHDSIENCRRAMSIAQKNLGIPAVLEPEYLASPWLDELSGMTYLSYFMKPGSPGFHATLRWVNSRLNRPVKNFTSDWNDGRAICEIIKSLGGAVPAPEKLRTDPNYWEDNLQHAINAGKKMGVQPVLSARDMADTHVEHLGVMAYAAYYQWIPERPPLHDLIVVRLESTSGRVAEPTYFSIELLDRDLSYNSLSAEIKAPDNKVYPIKLKNGNGIFIPQKIGMHEIVVLYNEDEVQSGHFFRVLPPMVEVAPPGMAPCALGSIVQVLVNATGAPKTEDIRVTAYSPHNRALKCPLTTIDGTLTASFKPDEPGEWRIEITYQGKQIQGGPFTCSVFDPNGVHVTGLEGALPLVPHVIEIDTHAVGVPGELHADIVNEKRSIHSRIERVGNSGFVHRLHFTPRQAGRHRIYVYFNGYDVRGSPYMMRVGTQKGKKSSSTSPITTSNNRLNTPSPIGNYQSSSKNRQSASPVYDSKYSTDYLKATVEKRISSTSPVPSFVDRKRPQSPITETQRMQSPSFINAERQRMQSPNFGSSEHLASKKLSSERRHYDYETTKQDEQQKEQITNIKTTTFYEQESGYSNKLHSMRIADSRSPVFMERQSSPSLTKHITEKSFNVQGYDTTDTNRIDTTPIIKLSAASDRNLGRRDAWDAIAKTKNVLSERSLESVANLTEVQLDAKKKYDASHKHKYSEEHSSYATRDQNYSQSYSNQSQVQSSRSVSKSGGASAVKVQPVPDGVIGQPVEFEIDGSGAGSGDLEILVEGGRVTSSVRSLGGQRFKAAFTPHQALPHRVDIRFNDDTVPGHRKLLY